MPTEVSALAAPAHAELAETIMNTAVDGMIVADEHGDMVMFNKACETIFGRTAVDAIGRNVSSLMPEPYRREHDDHMRRYVATGERRIIGIGREVTGLRGDGSIFPMHLSVGEGRLEGERVFVGIVHDLTNLKRAERKLAQAQKMEAVGQIAGGIAHDFNNLLTVILGNAELLTDTTHEPDERPMIDAITAAATRGAELTSRLLAFGRRQMLHPQEFDVNWLVRHTQMLLRRTLREDIALDLLLESDLPFVFADPGQLEASLLNLVLNAQHAMPDGGTLTISTNLFALDSRYRDVHPDVQPGEYVAIAVTDDGEGMAPEVRERVFEPFFTTKEAGKGSGLGLSMVYGFVKQSGGHVAIYSEPELGTTVRLYLPCAAQGAPRRPAEPPEEAAPSRRGGETVLVVEDDIFVRDYAVESLTRMGYRVVEAENGPDALTLLEGGLRPDLLFTDIVMPGGLNGWDLARLARAMRPEMAVLFTSGYPLETLIARGRLDSEAAILNKPYRRADLAERLRAVFGNGVA